MADLPVATSYLSGVEEPVSVKKKWILVQIQERKSRIAATSQQIEDLKFGQIIKLEGVLEMLNLELDELQKRLSAIEIKKEG